MDNVLAFTLETLSSKPLFVETEKNLFKELRNKFKKENLKSNNFKAEFGQALEVGQDLGIFRIIGENKSSHFSPNNKKKLLDSKSNRNRSRGSKMNSKKDKFKITDKEQKSSSRRGRSSNSRRQNSRSRSRRGKRVGSQRRRQGSRR